MPDGKEIKSPLDRFKAQHSNKRGNFKQFNHGVERRGSFSIQKSINEFNTETGSKIRKFVVKNELEQKLQDGNTIDQNMLDMDGIEV